jgi:hypothetical protein
MKRLFTIIALGTALSMNPASVVGQTGQELSIPEANRIAVPAPTHVRVENQNGHLRLNWDTSRLKRVVAYEVFNKAAGSNPVQVARVERPPLEISAPADNSVEYFVVAVDYRNNHSGPSQPVVIGRNGKEVVGVTAGQRGASPPTTVQPQ